MKKTLYTTASLLFVIGIIIFSCKKKTSTGVSPGYGNSKNPTTTGQTVTGNTTYTNPATENTSMLVGGSGWVNPTCGTTNSLSLKGINGTIDVTVSFSTTIVNSGTFAIAAAPASGACAMTILNAPNQPSGIVWYAKSGEVIVNVNANSITANIKNVVCTQQTFNFPTVVANGQIGCSQ